MATPKYVTADTDFGLVYSNLHSITVTDLGASAGVVYVRETDGSGAIILAVDFASGGTTHINFCEPIQISRSKGFYFDENSKTVGATLVMS